MGVQQQRCLRRSEYVDGLTDSGCSCRHPGVSVSLSLVDLAVVVSTLRVLGSLCSVGAQSNRTLVLALHSASR